jgi:predicted RND superfamily exporter protein
MQTIRDIIAAILGSARSSAMTRRGLITALLMLVSVPVIVWGNHDSLASMFNAPLRWIPRDSESRREFNRFLELFGSHEMVLVSWPGCSVDDARLDEIGKSIEATRQRRRAAGQPALFNHVLNGHQMLRQLTEEPVELTRESALRRLRGVVVGPDGKTSCVVVEVTDYGAEHRREMIDIVTRAVTQATGLATEDLVLAGPPIDGMAIDDESIRSLVTYSVPSTVISLILCWICLRSFWLSLAVLIVGVFGQGLMLAMVYWTGSSMNAILIVLPALIFVLTVSAGVHLINYFLEELQQGSGDDAPHLAIMKARTPCALAAVTTAIGLASLSVSEVQPVRDFGMLGAAGLVVCVGLLFLVVPAFMTTWLRTPWRARRASNPAGGMNPLLGVVSNWVWRHSLLIRTTCVVGMLGFGVGLVWLRTSVDVVSLLSADNQAVRDFRWFEEHIGPLVPVEVVVHFDQECQLDMPERVKVVSLVQQKIAQIEILDGAVSAATFLPPFPKSRSLRSTARRAVYRKRLNESRDKLVEAKYLAGTADGEAWRVSARILGQTDFDYGQFLVQLQGEIDPVLAKFEAAGYEGISATCTGVTAVVHDVQESLLGDLFNSFVTALVLVAIVMMFALRSIYCGLLAMMPNVFPTLLLFGGMGWADRTMDIGSVMTASVALGIAVDGTFHFLKWFVFSLKQGKSSGEAISFSYQHCGRALVQTTIICACGLLVFSFSGFLPARHFALMLMMMMIAALVGDLILLPALLAGRLGNALCRIYQPGENRGDERAEEN